MNSSEAQQVIESLRKGIPPNGFVRHSTVGRKTEIESLTERLQRISGGALLLQANYGSGKTHLLKFIKEEALSRNYVVSTVTLDANSSVRFNRMDQIFGEICRNIEIPTFPPMQGLKSFFDRIIFSIRENKNNQFWNEVTNYGLWDFSDKLFSSAMFVALRAWYFGGTDVQNIVADWLYQPWNFKSQRKKLYQKLVNDFERHFRDSRRDWEFYRDNVFNFSYNKYYQSWGALNDLNDMSLNTGFNGLVILFDEFEDVITNLNNISYQETAFMNLFHFYTGEKFSGKTFFAVTPSFTEKCKKVLIQKDRWHFDFSIFDVLPTFELSPLDKKDLRELSIRILDAHGIAYDWEPDLIMKNSQLRSIIDEAMLAQIQDRARYAIKSVVNALDDLYEDYSED